MALSYKVPMFHKNLFYVRCSWVESRDERQIKTFLEVFALFCTASFNSARIFLVSSLG